MVENILLKNITTGEVLTLGMTKTQDYILEYVDWGTVQGTHHTKQFYMQNGTFLIGTNFENRTVEIVGWVVCDTVEEIGVNKSFLNSFFNPLNPIDLEYEEYKIQFVPNTSVAYTATASENNEAMCKFKIEGTCTDPLFGRKEETKKVLVGIAPMFHFPLSFPQYNGIDGVVFGANQLKEYVAVINRSQVDVGVEIVFEATGPVTNPYIILNNNEIVKIVASLTYGEAIKVCTTYGEKGVYKREAGNNTWVDSFSLLSEESSFIQLVVGQNVIKCSAEENFENVNISVSFVEKYLEVQ